MHKDSMTNSGLTILRVVVGIVFFAHGWQKVFDVGFAGVAEGFTGMGVPLAPLVAPGVAMLELLGGLALIAGLLTRVVAVLLSIDMLSALFIVHLSAGFFLPNGYEFVLTLFGACMALALIGPGDWSADYAIAGGRGRIEAV